MFCLWSIPEFARPVGDGICGALVLRSIRFFQGHDGVLRSRVLSWMYRFAVPVFVLVIFSFFFDDVFCQHI
jgi:hypothetical protein